MSRKICVVTGTRAEYVLLRWLMAAIRDHDELDLQIIVTGMHLSGEFGHTYKEIEADGFQIYRKVDILLGSDTSVGVSKSIGIGIIGFTDALDNLSPDLLLVLGDRFEIFAAVTAALILRIPVAHLHGGEITQGALDDALRHSITKMSHLHFVATESYRHRVIQLGEQPDKVFKVGGLGIDAISRLKLLDREELENALQLKFKKKNLMITYHPATLEESSATEQFSQILESLKRLADTLLIFTSPNADAGGMEIKRMIEEFVAIHPNAHFFTSLGQRKYFSCVAQVDGVIGNSSSGLLEVPSFHVGTINIGSRQSGRLKASSVIDCEPYEMDIQSALQKLYSSEYQSQLSEVENPYGEPGAVDRILQIIDSIPLKGLVRKSFYDLNEPGSGGNR